jgi:hypothetical protein
MRHLIAATLGVSVAAFTVAWLHGVLPAAQVWNPTKFDWMNDAEKPSASPQRLPSARAWARGSSTSRIAFDLGVGVLDFVGESARRTLTAIRRMIWGK